MEVVKKLFTTGSDSYEIFYSCNQCFKHIKDGAHRYNCVDCVQSYDLCQNCVDYGRAQAHTEEQGPQHTFTTETQSKVTISSLVHKGSSLEQLVLNMFKYYHSRPAIGQYDKCRDNFVFITFGDVFEMVRQFANGLKKLMTKKGCNTECMISMCSVARLEWYLTDLACLLLGITTVPLGATSSREQMKFILRKAEVSVLVCSLETLKELVKILTDCPSLRIVILMDVALNCTKVLEFSPQQVPDNVQLIMFSEVMNIGKDSRTIKFSKIKHKPADMFTVQFTSGSTGDPKGCIFSRGTWKSRISKAGYLGYLSIWLSFHPPSHNLERKSFFVTLINGGKIGIFRGSMEHLFDDFGLLCPTIVASTPRLWTMLYNQYLKTLHEVYVSYQTQTSQKASTEEPAGTTPPSDATPPASGAATIGNHEDNFEHFDPAQVPAELRESVISMFKSKLGGRERIITTGGAPTALAVKRFIIDCFGGMVNDGYGSTEVGGIASDGHVLTTCNMKLLDVPEMGYWTTDNPPRGEICVKTPDMIDGYFKNPKISEEKFVDGYFLTGDIGVIDKGGEIRIIDRKKNLFKLSQGEFVSPEGLEGLYSGASHCISQMYVYGNSLQSNIVAVVVPEHEGLIQMARSLNLVEEDSSKLCQLSEVKDAYMKELQSIALKHSLPGWEVPADILLEIQPFSVENYLLTSTMKTNRPKLEEKYRVYLEDMYLHFNDSAKPRALEILVLEKIKKKLKAKEEGEDCCESAENRNDDEMFGKLFSQLGGDSLSAMQLSSLLREHLNLEVPVETILKKPLRAIFSDLLDMTLETHIDGDPMTMCCSWESEASMDSLLAEIIENSQCILDCDASNRASSILLTGSTGFLGRFILWELLLNSQISKVFCLIQNKEDLNPKDRIMAILDQLHSEMDCSHATEDKIVVMVGDLSEARLGLSSDDYTCLCQDVDTIIHNGAVVNSALPYSALKKCNVGSTKELIKMAMLCRPKFLHFVSSIGVYPPMGMHVNELVRPPVERLNSLSGYSQSKWVAESLVLAAIRLGKVRGNISRPGLIGPHGETGHANLQDWVCWLVRGLVRVGLIPTGQGYEEKDIYWAPVDQVAKAIVLISTEMNRDIGDGETDTIFHLVNSSHPTLFTTLTDALMTRHPAMEKSRFGEFKSQLSERSKISGDVVLGNLVLLLPRKDGWPTSLVYHSEQHKVRRLEEAGIMLGKLHDRYVDNYLDYIQSQFSKW